MTILLLFRWPSYVLTAACSKNMEQASTIDGLRVQLANQDSKILDIQREMVSLTMMYNAFCTMKAAMLQQAVFAICA